MRNEARCIREAGRLIDKYGRDWKFEAYPQPNGQCIIDVQSKYFDHPSRWPSLISGSLAFTTDFVEGEIPTDAFDVGSVRMRIEGCRAKVTDIHDADTWSVDAETDREYEILSAVPIAHVHFEGKGASVVRCLLDSLFK